MNNQFAINGFSGLTTHEIISFFISGAVFTGYAALVALSLYVFSVAGRPVNGRVRTAAVWHFVALLWFMGSIITEVWAAPAEKSFVAADTDNLFDIGSIWDIFQPGSRFWSDPNARLQKVLIGFILSGIGILCMLIGARVGARQKRRLLDQQVYASPSPAEAGRAVSVARS